MAYLDTSVLVAYYCPEPLSAKVQELLSAMEELTISPLVEAELHSAVAAKVRSRGLDEADARRVLSMFQVHLNDSLFRIVPIEAREYALARSWLVDFSIPLRTLDALHLAAASANGLALLTADHGLAKPAKHFGVPVELISPGA